MKKSGTPSSGVLVIDYKDYMHATCFTHTLTHSHTHTSTSTVGISFFYFYSLQVTAARRTKERKAKEVSYGL